MFSWFTVISACGFALRRFGLRAAQILVNAIIVTRRKVVKQKRSGYHLYLVTALSGPRRVCRANHPSCGEVEESHHEQPCITILVEEAPLRSSGTRSADHAVFAGRRKRSGGATEAPSNGVWLESVDLSKVGAGERRMGRSPRAGRTLSDTPLTLKGVVYPHGIGTDSETELAIDLHGEAIRFLAMVGMDDAPLSPPPGRGFGQRFGGANRSPSAQVVAPTVTFEVWLGNKKVATAGPMKSGDTPRLLAIDLTGAKRMLLVTHGASASPFSSGQADWGGALVVQAPGARSRPELFTLAAEPPPPIASGTAAQPAIHGPRVIGGTPGRPFLFKIPATGQEPLRFEAAPLPPGLSVDEHTGILSGSLQQAGSTPVQIRVSGPKGTATRTLTIVAGEHKLALTPPLGWNSWNVWGGAIDDAKIRQAADGMVKSGLAGARLPVHQH